MSASKTPTKRDAKKEKDNELQFVINDSHFAKVIVKANGPGPTEEGRGDGE